MRRSGIFGRMTCAVTACGAAACVDSFLIDPFLLLGLGVLYVALLRLPKTRTVGPPAAFVLGAATVLIFWIVSVSLYLDLEWIRWMWELCGASTGRDWMLNSGVFHFEYVNVSAYVHALSVVLFALYPLWMWLGFRLGYRLVPARPDLQ